MIEQKNVIVTSYVWCKFHLDDLWRDEFENIKSWLALFSILTCTSYQMCKYIHKTCLWVLIRSYAKTAPNVCPDLFGIMTS